MEGPLRMSPIAIAGEESWIGATTAAGVPGSSCGFRRVTPPLDILLRQHAPPRDVDKADHDI